jgi:hypothetical protein
MANKDSKAFCVIDHANKKADRVRANPNRKKLKALRESGSVADDSADDIRKSGTTPRSHHS